jgi:beta-glucosidase
VVAILGHAEGTKAPGIRDWPTALQASHHLMLGHGLAAQALSGSQVGITLNLAPVHGDPGAARRWDGHLNRWFLDPVLRGEYPADMAELYEREYGALDCVRDGDLATIATPTDFLGVNYYTPIRVREDDSARPLRAAQVEPGPPTTTMGWEVAPEGLTELLLRLRADYDGAAYEDPPADNGGVDDPERTAYLESHLAALRTAMDAGVDVRRYCVWSFLDNFEWEHGYDQRFGIVHVDYATQRRVPKRSALFYRDYIRAARGD